MGSEMCIRDSPREAWGAGVVAEIAATTIPGRPGEQEWWQRLLLQPSQGSLGSRSGGRDCCYNHPRDTEVAATSISYEHKELE